jgi:hypothetical protein
VLPNGYGQSPWQGGHSNSFGSTFVEPRDIATQHTTNYKAIMYHPTQTSREVTPSSDKEAPSDDATHCT